MLDVGSAAAGGTGEDDLAVFVDRLAAAGSDEATTLAQVQIRGSIGQKHSLPGVRRLAEALAASVGERPPAPRRPSEDSGSVVEAMRGHSLVVLEEFNAAAVAETIAALLVDGRRVVVTASSAAELESVREALPGEAAGRALDSLPTLTPGELRELRRLLATSTPGRKARATQQLPQPEGLPAQAEVAVLCEQASRSDGSESGAAMIPMLLADLEPARRDAVTSVANCVSVSLEALHPRGEREWAWSLLSDLIYGQHRPAFDRMLLDTAQAVAALDHARDAAHVEMAGPLPLDAFDVLCRYRDFLEAGGRSRSYFRSPEQREMEPLLRLVCVDGRAPETAADVDRVIEHIDLGRRLADVDAGCAQLGMSAPHDEAELMELADGLVKVGAAARSVGALRHDVLFIAENSPLSVPDVASAEQVARAILEYAEHGSHAEAQWRLDRMADEAAGLSAVTLTAPEHEWAVAALRSADAVAYAEALDSLDAARRELQDENREAGLLRRLGESAPGLAESWSATAEHHPVALGLACFVPMEDLLSEIPPPDTADVVLIVGAAGLGVERLLLSAVAPRLIAAVAPNERPEGAPSLLSVLHRAMALVIRGRSAAGGKVVRLAPRAADVSSVGRAGA